MPLIPGSRLGVYEVTAQIGEGGMGQVFRATDTKLKRQVALKILPPAFAADHDRLARFQREAEVLASLNHPHIAGLYGLEEADGVSALVMEFVDGEDLSQRIARGAIPIDEALPIANQIAEALEAAHEQGIIHRDLKPANIKVRDDGMVKVLDFGLAKAMDPTTASSANAMNSPTITSPAMTIRGVILGTAAYMSPEQAVGKLLDRRSDIFSFGCTLYEMLTGRRAFQGETPGEVLADVVKADPDWTLLPTSTPEHVGRLVRRCLVKDRRQRLQSVGEARIGTWNRRRPRRLKRPWNRGHGLPCALGSLPPPRLSRRRASRPSISAKPRWNSRCSTPLFQRPTTPDIPPSRRFHQTGRRSPSPPPRVNGRPAR